jgi:hypothetical protein
MRPFVLLGILALLVWATLVLSPGGPPATSQTQASSSAPPPTPKETASPWSTGYSKDDLTGVISFSAETYALNQSLCIRRIGKKFDCFVITNKFMETMENVDSQRSTVRYRFDSGPIEAGSWIMGTDHESLFVPGNAEPFIRRLSKAKTFVIQYEPAETVKESVTFQLNPFPAEIFLHKQKEIAK